MCGGCETSFRLLITGKIGTIRMCNLYSLTRTPEAIRRLFRVSSNRAAAIERRDAIFPGHNAAVVRKAEDGERELVDSWGFVLPQPGKC